MHLVGYLYEENLYEVLYTCIREVASTILDEITAILMEVTGIFLSAFRQIPRWCFD